MAYLFQDEFNGAVNSQPSAALWNIEVGNRGISSDVAQYTSSATYVFEDGSSNLVIAMGPVNTGGAGAGRYPSGWLDTYGKFALMANQSMEIAYQITPAGGAKGVWPAIWFQGVNNVVSGGPFGTNTYPSPWAELDAVESYGGEFSQPFSATTNFADSSLFSTVSNGTDPFPINLTAGPGFTNNGGSVFVLPAPLSSAMNIIRVDCIGSGTTVTELKMLLNGNVVWDETAAAANTARPGAWGYNTTASGGLFFLISGQAVASFTPTLSSVTPIMKFDYVRAWAPAGPDPNTAATGSMLAVF